ncbi:MAG: hypothetical protein NVS4B3_25870 [Gemmatimonadaceae bacterium]
MVERADKARVQGDSAARVWVVIVSDFQCPYCRMWHEQTYPALLHEYVATGKVRMAYLNFPLPTHQNAGAAAEAAMCAGAQDRFWPMQDALFRSQDRWSGLTAPDSVFRAVAVGAGVDTSAWRGCLTTHALRPLIDADRERSAAAGFIHLDSEPSGRIPYICRARPAVVA